MESISGKGNIVCKDSDMENYLMELSTDSELVWSQLVRKGENRRM